MWEHDFVARFDDSITESLIIANTIPVPAASKKAIIEANLASGLKIEKSFGRMAFPARVFLAFHGELTAQPPGL